MKASSNITFGAPPRVTDSDLDKILRGEWKPFGKITRVKSENALILGQELTFASVEAKNRRRGLAPTIQRLDMFA